MTEELDELHHDVGLPAMRRGHLEHDRLHGRRRALDESTHVPLGCRRCRRRRRGHAGRRRDTCDGRRRDALGDVAQALRAAAFPPAGLTGDLAVAAVAASLENLAVFAYDAGLTAATAGKLGAVPPAVATFATTVKGQHQQHADAWNAVLKSHGKAAVTVTNPNADARRCRPTSPR